MLAVVGKQLPCCRGHALYHGLNEIKKNNGKAAIFKVVQLTFQMKSLAARTSDFEIEITYLEQLHNNNATPEAMADETIRKQLARPSLPARLFLPPDGLSPLISAAK